MSDRGAEKPLEPDTVSRRLGQTEEGRMQRILVIAIGIGAVLAFGLTWLGADATPAYSLMGAASAALLGNAWLGGKRQEAKAEVDVAKVSVVEAQVLAKGKAS